MFFAVVEDRGPFMVFTSAIKGTKERIASIVLEKCELCLALDEGVQGNKNVEAYEKLKSGDMTVLKGFSFTSTDTSVTVLFYSENEDEYNDYVAGCRIDDVVE